MKRAVVALCVVVFIGCGFTEASRQKQAIMGLDLSVTGATLTTLQLMQAGTITKDAAREIFTELQAIAQLVDLAETMLAAKQDPTDAIAKAERRMGGVRARIEVERMQPNGSIKPTPSLGDLGDVEYPRPSRRGVSPFPDRQQSAYA